MVIKITVTSKQNKSSKILEKLLTYIFHLVLESDFQYLKRFGCKMRIFA